MVAWRNHLCACWAPERKFCIDVCVCVAARPSGVYWISSKARREVKRENRSFAFN